MSIGRKIAVGYLFLYGLLCLVNIPLIQDPLLDFLRSEYSNITWNPDPHPIAHTVLCTVAIISAIAILRKKEWALWLAVCVLVSEIPFSTQILANSMWQSRQGTTAAFPFKEITFSQGQPMLQILTSAFLCALSFHVFFVLLLNPWLQPQTTYIPPSQMKERKKKLKLRNRLLWASLAVFLATAWLGQCGPIINTNKQDDTPVLPTQSMSKQDLQKRKEALERKIRDLERRNAQLSKQILEDSINMELFVNSQESDYLLDQYRDNLQAALPQLQSMLGGQRITARSAVICLGEMSRDNQKNTDIALPLLQKALFHQDRAIQTLAAVMLIRLDQKDEPIRVLLQTLIANPDNEELLFAIGGLMEAGISIDEPAALAALTQSVNHPQPTITLFSARTLINSKKFDIVIPPMLKMLKHPQQDFRYFAAVMFWMMGPNAKTALAALESACRTETDGEVSIALMLAAAAMKGEQSTTPPGSARH